MQRAASNTAFALRQDGLEGELACRGLPILGLQVLLAKLLPRCRTLEPPGWGAEQGGDTGQGARAPAQPQARQEQ